MNSQTERLTLQGSAGAIEVARDAASVPDGGARLGGGGDCHPIPLFGGTMDNKVVQTLARAFVQCGWTAVRFNFRGVGATQGVHDEGRASCKTCWPWWAGGPAGDGAQPGAGGFRLGVRHQPHALARCGPSGTLTAPCLVGTAASRFTVAPVPPEAHLRTLVVHGEQDDTVALSAVMDLAPPRQEVGPEAGTLVPLLKISWSGHPPCE